MYVICKESDESMHQDPGWKYLSGQQSKEALDFYFKVYIGEKDILINMFCNLVLKSFWVELSQWLYSEKILKSKI